jgi:hypothetical protein
MNVKKLLLRVGQVVLIVLVTYGIVRALAPELGKVSADDLAQWKPHPGLLAVSTLMLLGVYLCHAFFWRAITKTLSGVRPGPKATLRIYFVSSLGRYIPGRLWQIAGLAMLAQKAGIPPVGATAASLVGQFAFLSSGLVYLSLLLPGWQGNAPIIAALVTVMLAAGGFAIFTGTRLGHNVRAWLTARFGARFGDALMLIDRISWRHALIWWVAYALTWALLGAAFVVLVSSFVSLDNDQRLHVAGTVAASYLAGYVMFFSVAGLGIREGTMYVLLAQVMPQPGALVVSVISRLWFTAAELLPLALIPIAPDEAA